MTRYGWASAPLKALTDDVESFVATTVTMILGLYLRTECTMLTPDYALLALLHELRLHVGTAVPPEWYQDLVSPLFHILNTRLGAATM